MSFCFPICLEVYFNATKSQAAGLTWNTFPNHHETKQLRILLNNLVLVYFIVEEFPLNTHTHTLLSKQLSILTLLLDCCTPTGNLRGCKERIQVGEEMCCFE